MLSHDLLSGIGVATPAELPFSLLSALLTKEAQQQTSIAACTCSIPQAAPHTIIHAEDTRTGCTPLIISSAVLLCSPEIVAAADTCTICLREFEAGVLLRRLPCLHSFHQPCIDAWMASNNTCPVCSHVLVTHHGTAD
jgi:hypothetical protein